MSADSGSRKTYSDSSWSEPMVGVQDDTCSHGNPLNEQSLLGLQDNKSAEHEQKQNPDQHSETQQLSCSPTG